MELWQQTDACPDVYVEKTQTKGVQSGWESKLSMLSVKLFM